MNHQRLKNDSDIHSEEEFHELLKRENIIIEDRATDIGKEISAEDAGKAVGRLSGLKACAVHMLERIYNRLTGITVHNTTIAIAV